MSQATIGRRTYPVPGRFNDLSGRQLSQVAGILHSRRPRIQMQLLLLLVLLRVKARPVLAWLLWWKVSDEQRHDLVLLTDFCFEEPKLTEQLLPRVRATWYGPTLYGPAGRFSNLTFAEWIACEGHFWAYRRTREVKELDQLVAILYRPHAGAAATTVDVREPFDPHTVAGRLTAVRRLPLGTRLAVRMWYASCRSAWARKYDGTLFQTDENAKEDAKTFTDPRETWNEVLADRAGSPDRYEVMGAQLLPNMFYDLDLRMRQRLQEQEALRQRSQTR